VLLLFVLFGALDAKIRVDLRRTLRRIQREVGTTTIFVTHDQEEAFELADRMGVMNVGRLLEVGPPEELYQRPQTEFVATFLGTANLLVGRCTDDGVQIGTLHFPLNTAARPGNGDRRVQVLFRPEDIALAATEDDLAGPALGRAEVEQTTFVGSFERLRLRLPPIAGVRPIAPAPPFGSDAILVEVTRSQDQARRFPLAPGEGAWIGVRRIHALAHPGLSFLIVTDGTPATQPAVDLGGQIARLANARTTVLGHNEERADATMLTQQLQAIRERIGSGLPALDTRVSGGPSTHAIAQEIERQVYDLVVIAAPEQQSYDFAEQVLQSGEHHLLIATPAHATPARVLICVAAGEPGKDDVLFAGRLLRHLGAEVTVLSVLSNSATEQERERAERFIAAAVRTLTLLGVPAQTMLRLGGVREEILGEMGRGGYDMLVLGAPLQRDNRRAALAGVVGEILIGTTDRPVLIVRSPALARKPWAEMNRRLPAIEEVLR
jgi:nucleotide-binding universal stress UspA family protein